LAQSFYIGPKYIPNGPQSLPNWTPIPSKWTQTIPPDPRSLATWIRNRQSLTPSWGFLITGGDNKFTVPCVSNLWVGRLRGNGLGRWATAGCNWAKLLALNKQQSCPLVHIHCRSMRRPLLGVLEVVEKCCLPPQSGRGHNLFWEGSLGMWVRKKKHSGLMESTRKGPPTKLEKGTHRNRRVGVRFCSKICLRHPNSKQRVPPNGLGPSATPKATCCFRPPGEAEN
jgi:hypothetical protein